MKHKFAFLFSLIAVLILVLAACGAPSPTQAPVPTTAPAAAEAPQPAEATATTQAPAAGGEVVTITIWDFGGQEFEWIDSMAIPAFQEKHPNIKIEHLGVPESDYSTKLDTAIAAGEVPDIALQSYTYKLWKAGHVLPLDEYMAKDGFKASDFYPIFQAWCQLDSKTYCLPVNVYIWAMLYNKDLFKAAGLPELTADSVITFDDWLTYSRAINKPSDTLENRVWGSAQFTPNWNAMNNYMSDPYVLGPDGRKCEGNAETEAWIKTWTDMVAAYKEDLTPDTAGSLLGEQGADDMFRQGKLGMIYGTYGDALAAQKAGINVGLTGQPVVNAGWQGNVGSWMDGYAIMSGSKHPNEAWEFLKFLTTDVGAMKANGDCTVCGNPAGYIPATKDWAGTDPLRQDNLKLLQRVVPPPFSPDIWTSVDPYYEAWRLMTEESKDVTTTVHDAAVECQGITDDLWAEWDTLGE